MKIGKVLTSIRKDKKMTQEEFAKLFNVTRQTISNWENEKSYPDLQTLVYISNTFNISLDSLLKEDTDMLKKFDNEIKQNKITKNIFKICGLILILILISSIIYTFIWSHNKKTVDEHFQNGITEIGFKRDDTLGYYFLKQDDIYYSLPNQKVPSFKFDYYNKSLKADFINENISIKLLDNNWIILYLNNNIQGIDLDSNGNIISSELTTNDKLLYDKNKEKISKTVKQCISFYNSVY